MPIAWEYLENNEYFDLNYNSSKPSFLDTDRHQQF